MLTSIPYRDPISVYAGFVKKKGAILLDSVVGNGLSYIAICPRYWIRKKSSEMVRDPFIDLTNLLVVMKPTVETSLPFTGGIVGFLGYELNQHLEKLPPLQPSDFNFPDLAVGLYESVIIFAPEIQRAWVAAPNVQNILTLAEKVEKTPDLPPIDWHSPLQEFWKSELDKASYEEKVSYIINSIVAGEVFQVNLSQRFTAYLPKDLTPFMLYRRLRILSPSPFAACLNLGTGQFILSMSPERFLQVDIEGRVKACPIKGTRPRGATVTIDCMLAEFLVQNKKDQAENLMIVDLLRNDLSKVCLPGSVCVTDLCQLESFASVHHLVSVIEGKLAPNRTAVDLLRNSFPGGSVTGAPKVRAMEILSSLESYRRGPYCGIIFWLGNIENNSTMDSSIIIRTVLVDRCRVSVHAGGGIISESSPEEEWKELMIKARPLLMALLRDISLLPSLQLELIDKHF